MRLTPPPLTALFKRLIARRRDEWRHASAAHFLYILHKSAWGQHTGLHSFQALDLQEIAHKYNTMQPKMVEDGDTTKASRSERDAPTSSPQSSPGRLVRWLAVNFIESSFFLNSYDLFQVYKLDPRKYCDNGNHHHHHHTLRSFYRIYDSLKIQHNACDRRRNIWSIVLGIWLSYLVTKSLICAAVQWGLLVFNQKMTQLAGCSAGERERWTSRGAILAAISNFIGNPLYALPGVSIFYYVAVMGSTIPYLVIMPQYFKKQRPLDLPDLRFMLDPRRELDRLDLTIGQILDKIQHSIVFIKETRSIQLSRRVHSSKELKTPASLWKLVDGNEQQIAQYQSGRASLRPPRYSQLAHQTALRDCAIYSVSIFVCLMSEACFVAYFLSRMAFVENCKLLVNRKSITSYCSPLVAFTPRDLLFAFELYLGTFLIGCTYVLHTTVIILTVKSQLELIAGIKRDLKDCLHGLRSMDVLERSVARGRVRGGGDRASELEVARERNDKLLLTTLIKFQVATDEYQRGNRCISTIIGTLLFVCVCGLTIILLLKDVSTNDSAYIQMQIFIIAWCCNNFFALLVSNTFARFSDLERLQWSILAENASGRRNFHLTSTLWRKYSFSLASDRQRYCARPFNLCVTYKTLLQINFYAISIGSLITSHKRA